MPSETCPRCRRPSVIGGDNITTCHVSPSASCLIAQRAFLVGLRRGVELAKEHGHIIQCPPEADCAGVCEPGITWGLVDRAVREEEGR